MEESLRRLDRNLLADDGFARELYAALCNVDWRETTSGRDWSCTWRYSGGLVADLRNQGEDYLDFYCSGGEGKVAPRVREALEALGWEPTAERGNTTLYAHDLRTGETRVFYPEKPEDFDPEPPLG